MLHFQNVSLRKGQKDILKEVNFSISEGEKVTIIGTSGAGKSSLFKLLIGEHRPTKGNLVLGDLSLSEINPRDMQKYRRQVGVVFQDFRLLPHKNVFENVAFALEVCGREHDVRHKVPQLLDLVGLLGKEEQFPHSLSGGEKQRLSIARALIHNPPILVADEPTGNLDPKNAREVADLFLQLNHDHNLTILCATHDPKFVDQIQPRVVRIQDGQIALDSPYIPSHEAFAGMM